MNPEIVFIHNVAVSNYKNLVFMHLYKLRKDFHVIHLAEREKDRHQKINQDYMQYPNTVLYSDFIENISSLKIVNKTISTLKDLNPGGIILSGYYSLLFNGPLLWGLACKKKIGIIVESHKRDKSRMFLKEFLKSIILKQADVVLVDGEKHKNYVESLGVTPDHVFKKYGVGPIKWEDYYYQTELHRQNRSDLAMELNVREKNFIFIGRLIREKNPIGLLAAYRNYLAATKYPPWGLIIVGSGYLMADLETYIRNYNLGEYVKLTGFMDKSDFLKYMAVSNALVLPSLSEPWGYVVNEAMACGLPVIVSTACGCHPDIVRDGINGFSFAVEELSRLTAMLVQMSSLSPEELLSMGRASLNIIKTFNPDNAAQSYSEAMSCMLGFSK